MKLKLYCEHGAREVMTDLSESASDFELMSWLRQNAPDCIAYKII